MPDQPNISRRDAADLAAFVDGRLSGRRLEKFEARLAADPVLAAEVERQRGAVSAIQAAVLETTAPTSLRLTVDAIEPAAKPARRRPSFVLPGVGITAAAAVIVALIFVGASGPTVDDALAFATKPPEEAVTPDPEVRQLLVEDVEGVRFPNYAGRFGFKATGERTDEVDGRTVRTVFYENGPTKIAYSIFEGEALDTPDGPEETREDVEMTLFDDDEAVTWQRDGHTCVMSGADANTMFTLASWQGKGAVTF